MVVAPLPMVKVGGLVLRTLTKPVAKVLKARSKIHPGLNSVCHSLGQQQHRLLIRFHMGYRGIQNYVIKDIPAEQAVEKGADLIGEVLIFSVALGVATFEYQRSTVKSRETERKQQELKAKAERVRHCGRFPVYFAMRDHLTWSFNSQELEERFEKLETQVLFLETKLAELGHIMEAGLTDRILISADDDNNNVIEQQPTSFVDTPQSEGFVVARVNRAARPRRS